MKLCVTLTGKTIEECKEVIRTREADLFELRIDHLRSDADFESLLGSVDIPMIATNRPVREGGKFRGTEEERLAMLVRAIYAGASFVDVESDVEPDALTMLQDKAEENNCTVILSKHFFHETPSYELLHQLLTNMDKKRPGIVKIITMAINPLDCLRILDLYHEDRFSELIAFAMGNLGRMTRVMSLLLGAPFMYVSSEVDKEAAPGQLTLAEIDSVLEVVVR